MDGHRPGVFDIMKPNAAYGRNQRQRKIPKREILNPKQIQNQKLECPKHRRTHPAMLLRVLG
jgi:hypothetical protein